jgi:hypothetical protein
MDDLFVLVDAAGHVLCVGLEKGDVWSQIHQILTARQTGQESVCQIV